MFPLGRLLSRSNNFKEFNKNVQQIQKRNFYEQFRSGKLEFEEKREKMLRQVSEIERIKRATKLMKENLKWSKDVAYRKMRPFRTDEIGYRFDDGELVKFWDFNQANNGVISSYPMEYKHDDLNDLNNWFVTCDADYDLGYSKATVDISPAGYALFHGYLDTTIPKEGKVERTGYAFFGSIKNRRQEMLGMATPEFEEITHICFRVRGDGRKYHIILNTSDKEDITWFDRYQYMLYTHGGPYWQEVRIPLSKFFLQYQGFIQGRQEAIRPNMIQSVGFLAIDHFSGPFSLEIDYVGFMIDPEWSEELEYEGYYHESAVLKK